MAERHATPVAPVDGVAPTRPAPRLDRGAPQHTNSSRWMRNFLAGGIAGCCAKTTIAPLDRVKILLQAYNPHYKHLGVFSTLMAIPRKEGFLGLYKGNGAMMVRIFPYGAIQFTAFEKYKRVLSKQMGITGHVHRLLAGSMAGITAVIFTYPLDMVRARLAYQVKGDHGYRGILHAFSVIYKKEGGVRGFYHGLVPTIIGMAPYAGEESPHAHPSVRWQYTVPSGRGLCLQFQGGCTPIITTTPAIRHSVEEAREGRCWSVGGSRPSTTMEGRGAMLTTTSRADKIQQVGTVGGTAGASASPLSQSTHGTWICPVTSCQ